MKEKIIKLVDHANKKCHDQLDSAQEMEWESIMVVGTTKQGLIETFYFGQDKELNYILDMAKRRILSAREFDSVEEALE
jgi:hypothetical protein